MSCDNGTDCTVSTASSESLGTMGTIEICIYLVCFIAGAPLNILSLHRSVRAFRQHKARSQILLLRINLNIADLLTVLVYVPKQIIWMLTFQWYGGELLCRLCSFFSLFSFYLNSFVIACIAIDRVYGAYNISSLNAHRKAYSRCRTLLTVGWIAAFVLSLPQTFIFSLVRPYENMDFKQCATIWTTFAYRKFAQLGDQSLSFDQKMEIEQELEFMKKVEHAYNYAHLLFVFWIPCIIIVFSYLTVQLILQGHLRQDPAPPTSMSTCCFGLRKGEEYNEEFPCTPPMSSFIQQEESGIGHRVDGGEMLEFSSHDHKTSFVKLKPPKLGAMAVTTIHKAKQHAKHQAALIILAYLTFWSPYNVLTLLNLNMTKNENIESLILAMSQFLNAAICANPIANPIIYGLFKKSNRK